MKFIVFILVLFLVACSSPEVSSESLYSIPDLGERMQDYYFKDMTGVVEAKSWSVLLNYTFFQVIIIQYDSIEKSYNIWENDYKNLDETITPQGECFLRIMSWQSATGTQSYECRRENLIISIIILSIEQGQEITNDMVTNSVNHGNEIMKIIDKKLAEQ